MRPMLGGLRGPRKGWIPGADVSGIIESVGPAVTRFSVGDAVYGESLHGGFAEYITLPEKALATKPKGLSFEEAAGIPMTFLTALQGLRDHGRLKEGQSVLINGAGGGVGTLAIQLAKILGASEIAAVCGPDKGDLVRSLGATSVIDYTTEDFTRSGERYDIVFDTVVGHSLTALRRTLTPRGTLILCGGGKQGTLMGPIPIILRGMLLNLFARQRITTFIAKITSADLEYANTLFEAGKLKLVISQTFPFAQAPDAIRLLEEGHATGKIVVTM
jgi:NADPH:quinone reductase-like Zn-dependent oxidoreductase